MRTDQPALLGGSAVRQNPFPAWPRADEAATGAAVAALTDVVHSGVWSDANGPSKTAFEQEFAAFHDARHGVAVCNGTISLQIALAALGIGSGDEVIVPAYTFIATATAVLSVNALPVFADIDPRTGCLDPEAAEAAITSRTRAIVPVHLGGHPADLDRLVQIAERHGLALVEDAAQAHGASWRGRRVGSFGAFGSWSFQASKNMTAGEGGMLVTSDDALAETAWSLHHCGRTKNGRWYDHGLLGGNYRLTEFQCAVLRSQLDRLPADLDRRSRGAAMLDDGLAGIDGLAPMRPDPRCTMHGYHLYQVRYDSAGFGGVSRGRFVAALRAEGIPAGAGYGVPLDRQPVFATRVFDLRATGYDPDYPPTRYGKLELPVTERFCSEMVWLPQYVLLGSDDDIACVLEAAAKLRRAADTLVG